MSSLSQEFQRVTCSSCQFSYPRVRGFCPLCGTPVSLHEPLQKSTESLPQKTTKLISFVVAMIVLILGSVLVIHLKMTSSISGEPSRGVVTAVASSAEPAATSVKPLDQSASFVTEAASESPSRAFHEMGDDPAELWRRVQKGNANAEVELAKLYLDGKGVVQNCEQAHLLLLAASRRRSSAASDVLSGDYAQRCR